MYITLFIKRDKEGVFGKSSDGLSLDGVLRIKEANITLSNLVIFDDVVEIVAFDEEIIT